MKSLHSIYLVALVCLNIALSSLLTQVDDAHGAPGDIVKSKAASSSIHHTRAGSPVGQVFLNAPLKVMEESDGWSKIQLEAWIKSDSVAPIGQPSKGPSHDGNILQITEFSIKDYGEPVNKIYVHVKIKNIGEKPVTSWKAFLVGKEHTGRELFRSIVANDQANLKPGEVKETGFYFEPSEPPYDFLKGASSKDLQLLLDRPVIQ